MTVFGEHLVRIGVVIGTLSTHHIAAATSSDQPLCQWSEIPVDQIDFNLRCSPLL